MQSKEGPRDSIACEGEVIHIGSAVQTGCGFLMIDPDNFGIVAANASLLDRFGTLRSTADLLAPEDAALLNADLAAGARPEARFVTLTSGDPVWISFFDAGDRIGADLTFVEDPAAVYQMKSRRFAACVQSLSLEQENAISRNDGDFSQYFQTLVEGMQALSEFDRVMLYQFDSDLNGTVTAEACATDDIAPFLGLKFPSGDIPRPARDLFFKNRVRQIIDVGAPPEPILATDGSRRPVALDQSNSAFRYTAPVHLEYLVNMGVRASLVIGIVVQRKLWGLVSCHNLQEPKQMPPNQLTLCHVLSDLASNHIARLIEARRTNASDAMRKVLTTVALDASVCETPTDIARVIETHSKPLLALLRADGFAFESETANWIIGDVPEHDALTTIDDAARHWKANQHRSSLVTSDLHRFCPGLPNTAEPFGGVAHFSSWDRKCSLRAFRKVVHQSETWAGDPDSKERYADTDPEALHPRNSFDLYRRETEGCAMPWDEEELQCCHELQNGLRNIEMTFHKSLRERELRQSNAEMRNALGQADYQAHHDQLTGVPNRRGFERDMNRLVPGTDPMWLCHIDVDHFKRVNDTFGHLAGDAALRHVAGLLNTLKGPSGLCARIGGDEFAMVLSGDFDAQAIARICEDLRETLGEAINFKGVEIPVSCTVGVTQFQPGAETLSEILSRSDIALYSGKTEGRGRFIFFSPDMEERTSQRRALEKEIEKAIETSAFVPYFQPQYCAESNRIVGCEVLSRWEHPDHGILRPDKYMRTAEQMGVIGEIDQIMFDKAVTTQIAWEEESALVMPLSVNISVERLRSAGLVADLEALGERARGFTLELLESIYLDDHEVDYGDVVRDLRRTGVGIEIDDFGTGRTSILAVLAVRPDRLKIDQRLIDPIVRDSSARALVKSILQIGDQLGISAVAEGVETHDHIQVLRDMNCERMQGYFLGRPQSAEAISERMLVA